MSTKACATAPRCTCGGEHGCKCVEGYPHGKCARCGAELRRTDPHPAPSAAERAWVDFFAGKAPPTT